MLKYYPTLVAVLAATSISTTALAHSSTAVLDEQNLGDFTLLNETYRWACYKGSDHNVLGRLSRNKIEVGAYWKSFSSRTLEKMELVLKASTDPLSLTDDEQGRLDAMSSWQRDKLLQLADAKDECEGDIGNNPLPTPTETASPVPTREPEFPTPEPTTPPSPTETALPLPTVTAVPTHDHTDPTPVPTAPPQNTPPQSTPTPRPTASPTQAPQTPPQGLPRLAPSNSRPGTAGITSPAIGNQVGELRGGPTRDTFRSRIPWTHIAFDDPIVYPGQPGRSHLHMFFGNSLVDASTTAENIRSRCQSAAAGGTANCSGYWMPALMNAAGEVLAPDFSVFYYKAGYQVSSNDAVVPPQGLAMITGNMMGSPTNNVNDANYHWSCDFQGSSPGIPDCPEGKILSVAIEFPTCWNGQDMGWSGDHKSHVARGNGGGGCPASHPVQIPDITLNAEWRVPAGGTRGFKLSSDMYEVNDSARGGYSMHADWIMGWDPAIMQRFLDNCNNRQIDCVVDNLGDGGSLETGHQVGMYR